MLDIVELSRLQFALTAMYHFLFVPLTLGMAFLPVSYTHLDVYKRQVVTSPSPTVVCSVP